LIFISVFIDYVDITLLRIKVWHMWHISYMYYWEVLSAIMWHFYTTSLIHNGIIFSVSQRKFFLMCQPHLCFILFLVAEKCFPFGTMFSKFENILSCFLCFLKKIL
jgi:hypothetical protein